MTDWIAKQKNCKRCHGAGFVNSEARHASGRGPAWAAKCSECQPQTYEEVQERVAQEEVLDPKR